MKKIRCLLILVSVILLPSCFDAEASFKFNDDETVDSVFTMNYSSQLYAMLAGVKNMSEEAKGVCEDTEMIVKEDNVICTERERLTLDEMLNLPIKPLGGSTKPPSSDDLLASSVVTDLGNGEVKFRLPFDFDFTEEGTEENPFSELFAASLAGRNFSISVEGLRILKTNGQTSEDGRIATMIIPIVDLMNSSPNLPSFFEVDLKYKDCGIFGWKC